MILGTIIVTFMAAALSIVLRRNCISIAERLAKLIFFAVTVGLPESRKRAAKDEILFDIWEREWEDQKRGASNFEVALLIMFHGLTVLLSAMSIRRTGPSEPAGQASSPLLLMLDEIDAAERLAAIYAGGNPPGERIIEMMDAVTYDRYKQIMMAWAHRSHSTRVALIENLLTEWRASIREKLNR